MSSTNTNLDLLQTKAVDLQRKIEEARLALQKTPTEITERQVEELNRRIQALVKEKAEIETRLRKLEEDDRRNRELVETKEKEIRDVKADIERYKGLEEKNKELDRVNNDLKEKSLEMMTGHARALDSLRSGNQSAISERESRIAALTSELEDLRSQRVEEDQILKDLTEKYKNDSESINEKIEAAVTERDRLKEEVALQKDDISRLQAEIARDVAQLESLVSTLESANSSFSDLQTQSEKQRMKSFAQMQDVYFSVLSADIQAKISAYDSSQLQTDAQARKAYKQILRDANIMDLYRQIQDKNGAREVSDDIYSDLKSRYEKLDRDLRSKANTTWNKDVGTGEIWSELLV